MSVYGIYQNLNIEYEMMVNVFISIKEPFLDKRVVGFFTFAFKDSYGIVILYLCVMICS